MNGVIEAANRNLKKIIQKMVMTYKDWHEMLPYALHGYRTSIRTSMGATPNSLVYGMETVLPIENSFDKKARPHTFKKGDMVLKKILPIAKDQRGKCAPNYEGPFVVKHTFSRGALILIDAEGQDLKHPINADSIKMFFPLSLIRVTTEVPTPEWCERKAKEVRHQENVTNPRSLALGREIDPNHEIVPTKTP
ncbi:hypothetical protein CR513_33701, partial [Mucuna pruriens]